MDLETQIVDIAAETLDALFDDAPAKTPKANDLIGAKQEGDTSEESDNDNEEGKDGKEKAVTSTKKSPQYREDGIDNLNLDDIKDEDELEEEEEEEEKPEKATKSSKKEETVVAEESEPEEGKTEVQSVLKSTVDYLIESGQWQDFEGREELDVTEEVYAKLVAQQDQLRVSSMFEELVDSTGPFGKAIIEFVKNGGSPDEIIDLFKEQKQVESISTESIEGQKTVIKQYFSEVMGWKPEKIEKYISQLVISGEVENEALETKELFKNFYKKEADRLNQERAEYTEKIKEAEIAFENNIRNTIKERTDLTPSERKEVEEYLLSYDQRLPNGNVVNKFYVNFAKMQADPQDYIDLALFVKDKQKFMQKVSTKEKAKATTEAFKFIKGNAAISTKKGSSHDQVKKAEKKSVGLDWGLPKK